MIVVLLETQHRNGSGDKKATLSVVVSIILTKVNINLERVSWYLHVFLEVAASLPNIEVVVGERAAILMGGERLRFTRTNTQQHLVHLCI